MNNLYKYIKPCPCCGRKVGPGDVELMCFTNPGVEQEFYIQCRCGLRTPYFSDFEEHAILWWNGLHSQYNDYLNRMIGCQIPDELVIKSYESACMLNEIIKIVNENE